MQVRFLLTCVMFLTVICGCSSYRYTSRVVTYPREPMHFGEFSITEFHIDKDRSGPLDLVKAEYLASSLGESPEFRRKCTPIQLRMRPEKPCVEKKGSWGVLHNLSMGVLPGQRETTVSVDVDVKENGKINEKRHFKVLITEEERFTPLGLWPFMPNGDSGCYAAILCLVKDDAAPVFNRVLGSAILSGLTFDL